MATQKIARAGKPASAGDRPILRNYSIKELAALDGPQPWPIRDRKGNRSARKALEVAMNDLADQACTMAFNASFAESVRLRYPRVSSHHFLRMYFRAMNKQITWRMRGAGVRP